MQLIRRHFGFLIARDLLYDKWYALSLRFGIGVGRSNKVWPRYRYIFAADIWLIPNWILRTDLLGYENGSPVFQTRVIGVAGWPHRFWALNTSRESA